VNRVACQVSCGATRERDSQRIPVDCEPEVEAGILNVMTQLPVAIEAGLIPCVRA